MTSISPFLWFDTQAEEAANFYISLFPNSTLTSISRYPDGGPMAAGTALGVSFVLDGLQVQALNGGPLFTFTEAISFFVSVETQAEVDHYWDALLADGGVQGRCGWLKDRFGLSWQIVPTALGKLLGSADSAAAGRVMQTMMGMNKFVISELEDAFSSPLS